MGVTILLAALTVFRVDPWSNTPFLPDADPRGGVEANELAFAAAQGEIEAVSFVVRPDADYEKVDVVPSDLAGPDGAKIPSGAADVTLVKVWFRPAGRWNTSWRGDIWKPEPISTLVLHDDALVKVDWEKKSNFLRADYADGPVYLDIRRRKSKAPFSHDLEPVKDAPKFVPFDLKKGFRQQYLVTWKVPKDAKPGVYKGTITLSTPSSKLSTLNLSLEVYPFALPRPRTHYDTREPYLSYWMGVPSLGGLLAGGHRLDRAERKLRAIFRNLVEHNAINLSAVGTLSVDSTDDYALRTLLIARQEGMCADGLINGMSLDVGGGFAWNPGQAVLAPEDAPERYQKSLDGFREVVRRQNAILDKYLGHHRCYRQSIDECPVDVNRWSYGYWNVIHELGGRTWTDFASANEIGTFVDMNDVPAHIGPARAWGWHATGAKALTYSATFTGPENPDLWRRNKGIRLWYADFDGQHEYDFHAGQNRWNDFANEGRYCEFGIVYLTADGLVSTLAWEAVRESLDDVRYFSLLRLRAEAALGSSDPETRKLGRTALVWQDGVDPEYVLDLDAFRRETAEWIKRLVAKVGSQPADKDTELPPPAEIPPDSRWQGIPKPSAGAKAVLGYAARMTKEDRYDLALVALEGLAADKSVAPADLVQAAVKASELHSAMRERAEAVAVLDRALSMRRFTAAERGLLHLARGKALMTDAKFEEVYSVRQLGEAERTIGEALKCPGLSEGDRAEAILKLTRGYFAAGDHKGSVAYAEARLKDTALSKAHQADLLISVGESWNCLEAWPKALAAFKRAHAVNGNDKDRSFRAKILIPEAKAAEMVKDYERAASCWADAASLYDGESEAGKIKAAKDNAARLTALARKNMKTSVPFDDGSDIGLDE